MGSGVEGWRTSPAEPRHGADRFQRRLMPGVGLQKSEVEHAWSRVVRVSSTSGRGGIMPVPR
jgi:hypothetical protein